MAVIDLTIPIFTIGGAILVAIAIIYCFRELYDETKRLRLEIEKLKREVEKRK